MSKSNKEKIPRRPDPAETQGRPQRRPGSDPERPAPERRRPSEPPQVDLAEEE